MNFEEKIHRLAQITNGYMKECEIDLIKKSGVKQLILKFTKKLGYSITCVINDTELVFTPTPNDGMFNIFRVLDIIRNKI